MRCFLIRLVICTVTCNIKHIWTVMVLKYKVYFMAEVENGVDIEISA
jgi:hypothetical protein